MKNDVDKKYGEGTYDEVIALEKRGVDLEHDDDYPEHLRQAFWFLEKQDQVCYEATKYIKYAKYEIFEVTLSLIKSLLPEED